MPWNFGLLGVVATVPVSDTGTLLAPLTTAVPECFDDQCTLVIGYTGDTRAVVFDSDVTNVTFEILGGQGGKSGGSGGRVTGSFINPPSVLYATVAGAGGSNTFEPGGFNGGGTSGGSAGSEGSGGGASDIRTSLDISSRIIVAGGGGGRGSGFGSGGGPGGNLVADNGRTGQGQGGFGGSQIAGGGPGASFGTEFQAATSGTLGTGGSGAAGPLHGGGGGGGGYYGGGGGGADADSCCTDSGGGGGGSSYADPTFVNNVVHTKGVRPSSGQITISWTRPIP
jgi:hypothetical protein